MIVILMYAVFIALIAAFFLLLLRKIGVVEYIQVHGNNFFAQMFSCDFCLSWWSGVVIAILATAISGDLSILITPFISTPITRKML